MDYSGTNTDPSFNHKKVVVETSLVLSFLETALSDHFGAAAQYLNLKSILFQLVENRISGDVMACCIVIKKQLGDYGLEETLLDEVFDAVRDQMNRVFNLVFEYDIRDYVCNFQLTGRGDTLITILSERHSTVPVSLSDVADRYLEEADDNGDYVPERLRRALEEIR